MSQSIRRTTAVAALLFAAWATPQAGHAVEEITQHQRCSSCHLGERPGGTAPAGAAHLCRSCHGDMVRTPSPHPDCEACHEPHDNGRPYQLRAAGSDGPSPHHLPTTDLATRLCLSCHDQLGQTRGPRGHFIRHPVGVPLAGPRRSAAVRMGLPLVDTADTLDPSDDVISCITCHDVHAGEGEQRLRWNADSEPSVCRGCHVVDGTTGPLLARSGH